MDSFKHSLTVVFLFCSLSLFSSSPVMEKMGSIESLGSFNGDDDFSIYFWGWPHAVYYPSHDELITTRRTKAGVCNETGQVVKSWDQPQDMGFSIDFLCFSWEITSFHRVNGHWMWWIANPWIYVNPFNQIVYRYDFHISIDFPPCLAPQLP